MFVCACTCVFVCVDANLSQFVCMYVHVCMCLVCVCVCVSVLQAECARSGALVCNAFSILSNWDQGLWRGVPLEQWGV